MTKELRSSRDTYKHIRLPRARQRTEGSLSGATWKGPCRVAGKVTSKDTSVASRHS